MKTLPTYLLFCRFKYFLTFNPQLFYATSSIIVSRRGEVWGGWSLKIITEAFLEELEIAVARRILSKSELSEEKAIEIGEEIKEGIAKRHGL